MKTFHRLLVVLLFCLGGTALAAAGPIYLMPGPNTAVRLSPNGATAYVGGITGGVWAVDVATGIMHAGKGHSGPVKEIAASSSRVLSVGDMTARIRNVHGDILVTKTLGGQVITCDISPDGSLGVAGVEGKGAVVFALKDGAIQRWLTDLHPHPIVRFVDGHHVIISTSASVNVLDWRTGVLTKSITAPTNVAVMELSPNHDMVLMASDASDAGHTVTVSSVATGNLLGTFVASAQVTALALRPQGGWIAVGQANGFVSYFDPAVGHGQYVGSINVGGSVMSVDAKALGQFATRVAIVNGTKELTVYTP